MATVKGWGLSNTKWGIGDRENLSDALRIIDALLSTTELNMDDMEPETLAVLDAASNFQREAACQGFQTVGFDANDEPKPSAYSCGEHEDHTSYESASRCILARPR